jgi:hypothetical protein
MLRASQQIQAMTAATVAKVNQAFREQSQKLDEAAAILVEWYHSTPLAKKRAAKAALVALLSRVLPVSTVHRLLSALAVDRAYSPATQSQRPPTQWLLITGLNAPNAPPTGSMTTQGASSA